MNSWLHQAVRPVYEALRAKLTRAVTIDQLRATRTAEHKEATVKNVGQHNVAFAPEAQEQLVVLYRYFATLASPEIAKRYANSIVAYCESLRDFAHRGTRRGEAYTAFSQFDRAA